jgi:L-amino acid N-acyltransferase YncA
MLPVIRAAMRVVNSAGNARIAPFHRNGMKTKTGSKRALKNLATSILLRSAARADLTTINDIYNHYVLHSTCTYQEEPEPIAARRRWFDHHGAKHPVIVAEVNGEVVGWGALSGYHTRSAYRRTVENSVYVHHQHHRRGIGSLLLKELIARARTLGHHAIIAGIDADQVASVVLHDRFGFQKVGHFRQVGFKFGRWLDVVYMEMVL